MAAALHERPSLPVDTHDFTLWFLDRVRCNALHPYHELTSQDFSWVNDCLIELRANPRVAESIHSTLRSYGYDFRIANNNGQSRLIVQEIADSVVYFYQNFMRVTLRSLLPDEALIASTDYFWAPPLIQLFLDDAVAARKRCAAYLPEWDISLAHHHGIPVLHVVRTAPRAR